ncbi:type II toxin-antitoxin system Phd/YefM family antitoxin [Coraliomargarita parva]|uniref:type II toxin-antitoxin system Phd/YefM family antitoxin n=1 Tax=Coraliomargarita parva TaxID=3014050 RepID=UPI0022B3D6D9|nr:hypothetical protein [Coraliomargarita parva]
MKTVSKGRLKAKMLAYFREVEASGEPLIVTDHGREVLEVRPVSPRPDTTAAVLASYRSGVEVKIPDEAKLMKPEAAGDWESLKKKDRNPW